MVTADSVNDYYNKIRATPVFTASEEREAMIGIEEAREGVAYTLYTASPEAMRDYVSQGLKPRRRKDFSELEEAVERYLAVGEEEKGSEKLYAFWKAGKDWRYLERAVLHYFSQPREESAGKGERKKKEGKDGAVREAVASLQRQEHAFLERNLRLVVYTAKKYKAIPIGLEDKVGYGNMGLIRALDKFDHTLGYKFSTYARWWIRQAIEREGLEQSTSVRLPVHFHDKIHQIRKLEVNGRTLHEMTDEEIHHRTGLSISNVCLLRRSMGILHYLSMDDPIRRDSPLTYGEIISDLTSVEQLEERDFQQGLQQVVAKIFASGVLSPREEDVVKRRFGIGNGGEAETLDELSRIYGISPERVRQVEKEAHTKIKRIFGDKIVAMF